MDSAIGLRVKAVLLTEYNQEFAEEYESQRDDFKFKKKTEHEKNSSSLHLIMQATKDKWDEINDKIKLIEVNKSSNFDFIRALKIHPKNNAVYEFWTSHIEY